MLATIFSIIMILSIVVALWCAIMLILRALGKSKSKHVGKILTAAIVIGIASFVVVGNTYEPKTPAQTKSGIGDIQKPSESSAQKTTPEPEHTQKPSMDDEEKNEQTTALTPTSTPAQTPKPSPTPATIPKPEKKITVSDKASPMLYKRVTVFTPINYSNDGLNYTLIGGDCGSLDSEAGIGLNADDSIGLAFTVGLRKGASKIGNRDALLSFYFEVKPDKGIIAPRDISAADLKLEVKDDQGEDAYLVYNSLNGNYPTLDSPLYGVVLFATYSDSKYFTVKIGDIEYKLVTDDIKYLTD